MVLELYSSTSTVLEYSNTDYNILVHWIKLATRLNIVNCIILKLNCCNFAVLGYYSMLTKVTLFIFLYEV